jgi:AraC family transcriptional regulator
VLAVCLLRHFERAEPRCDIPDSAFTRKQMSAIDDYVSSHIETGFSVSELAAQLRLGSLQFSRRLKATTGMSPYQYITHARVGRACELLATTRRPIADVGIGVGFSGQSHFSSRFKQIIGTTPREYRASRCGSSMHA